MKRTRLEYDLAYGCFLFSGLPPLIILAIIAIPMDPGSTEAVGILILLPVFLASLAAMIGGILLSIRLWRHWPLAILSGISVLYFRMLFVRFDTSDNIFTIHCAGVITTSGIWFLILRKKWFPPDPKRHL